MSMLAKKRRATNIMRRRLSEATAHRVASHMSGYPAFDLDLSKFDVVVPKVDQVTGMHVWPRELVDD